MDVLTFISNIVGSVVWPLTTLVIIFLLRRELMELLGRINSFKWKDFEAKFDKTLREIEKDVRELPKADSRKKLSGKSSKETLEIMNLVSRLPLDPHWIVIRSWNVLEAKLNEIATRLDGEDFPPGRNYSKMVKIIRRSNKISDKIFDAIDKLRELRNLSAHSNTNLISVWQAEDYEMEVQRIVRHFDSITFIEAP